MPKAISQSPSLSTALEAMQASGPLLVRLPEASALSGVPEGWLKKSFMKKRPTGAPPPPPHIKIGRAVYIIADKLPSWIAELAVLMAPTNAPRKGRPTKAETILRRQQTDGEG